MADANNMALFSPGMDCNVFSIWLDNRSLYFDPELKKNKNARKLKDSINDIVSVISSCQEPVFQVDDNIFMSQSVIQNKCLHNVSIECIIYQ